MPVTESEFLTLAAKLGSSADEIELRCSMSRAYYSLYHYCVNWYVSLGVKSQYSAGRGGMHDRFIAQLAHPSPSLSKELSDRSKFLAEKLKIAKAQRVVADYKLGNFVTAGQAKTQLQHAISVLAPPVA